MKINQPFQKKPQIREYWCLKFFAKIRGIIMGRLIWFSLISGPEKSTPRKNIGHPNYHTELNANTCSSAFFKGDIVQYYHSHYF